MKSLFRALNKLVDPLHEAKQAGKVSESQPTNSGNDLKVGPFELKVGPTLEILTDQYKSALIGSPEEQQALNQINKQATTFDDWMTVLGSVSADSPLGQKAIERLKALAVDAEDWGRLLGRAQEDATLGSLEKECKVGLEKTLVGADLLAELVELYDEIDDDSPLVDLILEKIKTCTEPFDNWLDAYSDRIVSDNLSKVLLGGSIKLAESPEDWITLWNEVENSDDPDLLSVREALEKVEWPEEHWAKLRDDADEDSGIETLGFKKLLTFRTTVADVLRHYKDYVDDFGAVEENEVVRAIFAKLFSLASPQEVEIISIMAPDDDWLHDAAERHINKVRVVPE